jgi:DNA-binding PadR family transcriptional regulator
MNVCLTIGRVLYINRDISYELFPMNQMHGPRRNLWSLTVLCMLSIRPMHPYELQRLIREWHKEDFLELKRGSLYHAIERLEREGFIEVVETSREGRRPERTIYRLTEQGERELFDWLRQLLAKPVQEPTQFFAALSFLPHLPPESVLAQLRERVTLLDSEIAGLKATLQEMVPRIGRLVLVEIEYALAMRQAELAWVKSLIEDLQNRRLTWDPEALRRSANEPAQEKMQHP